MEEKLNELYNECIEELKSIGIDVIDNELIGKIDICFSKRNTKRYGCCKYASFINKELGYNIKTLGNKEEDFKKSNLEYKENLSTYKYKIICKGCGTIIYRQRLKKNSSLFLIRIVINKLVIFKLLYAKV